MIPKIIHQLWKTDILPEQFAKFANKWKLLHPTWQYKLWTDAMIDEFVYAEYPEFAATYNAYPYHIQRVDAVRYLILNKIGGVYIDLDMEPIKPIDELMIENTVFAIEHPADAKRMRVPSLVSNAFMASAPNTDLFDHVIQQLYKSATMHGSKRMKVMNSTGPLFLTRCVIGSNAHLLPYSAFFSRQFNGNEETDKSLVFGIHHFASTWW